MKKRFLLVFALNVYLATLAVETNGWMGAQDRPIFKARAENKLLLVNFTSSERADECAKEDTETLATPEFKAYAATRLVLVRIESSTNQTAAVQSASASWKKAYAIQYYPTLVLIDANGRELGRQNGYFPDGPAQFTNKLERWKADYITALRDPGAGKWLTDLPQALAKAKSANKLVLMDFTGSDWCVWCMRLDGETLSKPEFIDYAKTNLVLVQLDYPQQKPQPAALKSANAALQAQYNVQGFPTLIALKPDGTVVWRIDGYLDGGPQALIGALEAAKTR